MRKHFALAAISLALCVALVVMWAGSYRARSAYEFWRADGLWEVVSNKGHMGIDNGPNWRLQYDRVTLRIALRQNEYQVRINGWFHRSEDHRLSPAERAAASEEVYRLERWKRETYFLLDDALQRDPGASVKASPPVVHILPYPIPVAAAAVLPFAWLVSFLIRRRRRAKRLRAGLCVGCGYDLRGSGARRAVRRRPGRRRSRVGEYG